MFRFELVNASTIILKIAGINNSATEKTHSSNEGIPSNMGKNMNPTTKQIPTAHMKVSYFDSVFRIDCTILLFMNEDIHEFASHILV